jgi:putative two-component system response regulator
MNLVDDRPCLLIVDDEPVNLHVLRNALQGEFRLIFATDGFRALSLAQEHLPQLILLDIVLPDLDGYAVCNALKADPETANIPVIFVTSLSQEGDEARGFDVGAVDYITKPISLPVVRARVRTHLSLVNLAELQRTQLEVVRILGRAAEYKDNETGTHVIRMSKYAHLLAKKVGCPSTFCAQILHAAAMHDIGKIGIPDAILQKPGKLDDEEWTIIKQHPEIGARIIGEHASGMLKMACTVALAHHEKWNGNGYPKGLAGEDIPLAARIAAIADVFDAVTTVRPYKRAWSFEEALTYLQDGAGQHFDPALVEVFLTLEPELREIYQHWAD